MITEKLCFTQKKRFNVSVRERVFIILQTSIFCGQNERKAHAKNADKNMLLKKAMEECKIAACLYQLEGQDEKAGMQKSMVRD